jgi:hypothetical protein
MLLSYVPSRSLRSSGTGLLTIPKPRTKIHGEAAFNDYALCLWQNTHLPENLRGAKTVDIFKRDLKTHIFSLAFPLGDFFSLSVLNDYSLVFSSSYVCCVVNISVFNIHCLLVLPCQAHCVAFMSEMCYVNKT